MVPTSSSSQLDKIFCSQISKGSHLPTAQVYEQYPNSIENLTQKPTTMLCTERHNERLYIKLHLV